MKSRHRLHRIIASVVLFCLLVLNLLSTSDSIFAANYEYYYVFFVEGGTLADCVKGLKVTDTSKAKIVIVEALNTSWMGNTVKTYGSELSKATHSAVVYIPTIKGSFGNFTKMPSTADEQDKVVSSKLSIYKTFLKELQTGNKAEKKLGLTYYWENLPDLSLKSYNTVASSLNKKLKAKFKKANGIKEVENNFKDSASLSTYLKSNYEDIFKYLDGTVDTSSGDTSTSQEMVNTEDMLKSISADVKYKDKVEKYAKYMLNIGYSKAAVAGVLANARAESGFNPETAGGLFGMSIKSFSSSDANKSCTHTKKDIKNNDNESFNICVDGECQIIWFLSKLGSSIETDSDRLVKANTYMGSHKPTEFEYSSGAKSWGTSSKVKWPTSLKVIKNVDEFKVLDNPVDASLIFMCCHERNAGSMVPCGVKSDGTEIVGSYNKTYNDFMLKEWDMNSGRPFYAEKIYAWLGGNALDGSATVDAANEMVKEAQKKGYLTEEELSAWSKIINENYINYKEVNRDGLSQSDLSSLNTWETNVKYDELENHGIFNFFRKLFVGIGILMLLYSGILYCCYWLDRINPFYDIDFLDFATIGKLATAPTEDECNFHVKDFFKDNKDKAKYVNHKAIITICLGLIIFGLMIITGSIYKIVIGLIGLVGDILNIE